MGALTVLIGRQVAVERSSGPAGGIGVGIGAGPGGGLGVGLGPGLIELASAVPVLGGE